ncbi:hypothetical protein ACR9E3_16480 [Actinomycetospora sp. C-140]
MIAAARVVLGLLLAVVAVAGCSSDYTEGTSGPAARPDQSLEAARTKLELVQQDACYTSRDVAGLYPRCGRWEEEVLNVANAASVARPGQPEITDPAAAVVAGHDHFLRAGCATGGAPPECVAAMTETREAVTSLGRGITTAR